MATAWASTNHLGRAERRLSKDRADQVLPAAEQFRERVLTAGAAEVGPQGLRSPLVRQLGDT